MIDKEIIGYLSLAVTTIAAIPYYYSMYRGTTKPHTFSWLVWGILTAIGFAAQYTAGAGPGAWTTALSSLMCFSIAIWALFIGERNITRSDWVTFLLALAIIPCWYATKDPLIAIILVSAIDMLGYWPTFRKSYHKPHEEQIFIHAVGSLKWVVAIFATENLSLTTWLYPVCIIVANSALVLMLIIRRRQV